MTPRGLLLDYVGKHGVVGMDADIVVATMPDCGTDEGEEYAETHDWDTELEEAREAGQLEDVGCGWVRRPLAWWVAKTVTEYAVPEAQARRIVHMLAGSEMAS